MKTSKQIQKEINKVNKVLLNQLWETSNIKKIQANFASDEYHSFLSEITPIFKPAGIMSNETYRPGIKPKGFE